MNSLTATTLSPLKKAKCSFKKVNVLEDCDEEVISPSIRYLGGLFDKYTECDYKKWVKLIPYYKAPLFSEYKQKDYFKYLTDIVLDDELNSKGKKKRNTLIALKSTTFDEQGEWLYLITINNRIVKIGGTRNSIIERFGSYLCGHHIIERGKSGKASQTNMYVYNTLYFYLSTGPKAPDTGSKVTDTAAKVKLYGYKLPEETITRTILDKSIVIKAQTYHTYESLFINDYKDTYGFTPYLCDNSDPDYR